MHRANSAHLSLAALAVEPPAGLIGRVERLAATLLLLREGPQTAGEIARRFGVSRRTVIRDVQSLCAMGVPVESRDGAGGGYRLAPSYSPTPLTLDAGQTFLLLLALDALGRLADTPFAEARGALEVRLRAALPPEHLPGVERMLDAVWLDVPRRRRRTPHLEALVVALQRRRWLHIRYRAADHEVEHHIFPHSLYAANGYWYVHAYALERGEERRFRVDRISRLRTAGTSYQRIAPPAQRPYDDPAHPEVVVELTARGAAILEHEPHIGNQIVRDQEAPGLRFRCPPSELGYYVRLFGGLGADARVLAPPELCAGLADLAHELRTRYQR